MFVISQLSMNFTFTDLGAENMAMVANGSPGKATAVSVGQPPSMGAEAMVARAVDKPGTVEAADMPVLHRSSRPQEGTA